MSVTHLPAADTEVPEAPERRLNWKPLAAGAAVVLLIAAVVAAVAVTGASRKDAAADLAAQQQGAAEADVAARSALMTRFTDAELTFGKSSVYWNGDTPVVCGVVDIVEDQDLFDGYERLIYLAGALTIEEVDGSDVIDQKWSDICR